MLSIDIENPDVLKDFNIIIIGAVTKQYARDSDSDIIGASDYNKHFFSCLKDTKLRKTKYMS